MSGFSLRRAVAAVVSCAALVVLAACGSSSVDSQLHPTRLVSFGDAFSDLGQNGGKYTVNDGTVNHWLSQLALRYGRTLTASAAGGTGYGQASARITDTPDAAGSTTTPTVTQQIDTFLAGNTLGANDLVILSGGIGDLIVETNNVTAGIQTRDQMLARAQQIGRAMGLQARRLVTAGATHVVVVGPYDLSKTPWGGADATRASLLAAGTLALNNAAKLEVESLGSSLLIVDAALYFNLYANGPNNYALSNSAVPACNSVDAGAGIGIGTGQLNSSLCTASTIVSGVDYSKYMFADAVYATPVVQRLFGDQAYGLISRRW